MAKEQNKKSISDVLDNINKKYGKGTITSLGSNEKAFVKTISSGSLDIDRALGGGYAVGRIVEMFSDPSCGKSSLALHAIAEVQKSGGKVAYLDTEHAMDKNYAQKLGVDINNLVFTQPDCISTNSLILTKEGYKYAKDFKIGDSLFSLNQNNKLQEDFVTNIMTSSKKLKRVHYSNGFIDCSDEHRIHTSNGWKMLKEIDFEKDYILSVFREDLCFENFTELNKELSFLLGCFFGDGSYEKNVSFTGKDELLNEKIIYIVNKYFNNIDIKTYKYSNYFTIKFSKKENKYKNYKSELHLFLEKYLGCVSGKNKKIPSVIFKSGYENICSFLSGLIMTDGHVNLKRQQVEFCNYIENCIYDVSYLFSKVGIFNRIRFRKNKNGKTWYEIRISDKHSIEVISKDFELLSYKKEILNKFNLSNKESIVRFPKFLWKVVDAEILKKFNKKSDFYKVFYDTDGYKYPDKSRDISEDFLLRINNILNSKILNNYLNSDIIYNKIRIVEELPEQEVLDFTVSKNHNFVCNNLSVHNSAEECLSILNDLLDTNEFSLIVVDSIAAMTPEKIFLNEPGEQTMALLARLLSIEIPKVVSKAAKSDCTVLFLNQTREKVGGFMGGISTPGGKAIPFYASQRIHLFKGQVASESGEATANNSWCRVIKNKVAPPMREAKFTIKFGEGLDKMQELVDFAVEYEVIQKSGSWYSYGDTKLGQGSNSVKTILEDNPELLEEIQSKLKIAIDGK